jgi:N-acetylglucosamine malate deacetylase 1
MKINIFAIVAHPDDEVLGCGGTLARHVKNGDSVSVLFLADGEGSRLSNSQADQTKASSREAMAHKAGDTIGIKDRFFLCLPDNKMDSVPFLDIVQQIEPYVKRIRPKIIYTHHAGDLNIDHRLTHQAVITANRPQPGSNVSTILCFETPSSTEWQPPGSDTPFCPNWFVDISSTLGIKIAALEEYAPEVRQWPHARSIQAVQALAKWRGSSIGVNAAEAFVLARHIMR